MQGFLTIGQIADRFQEPPARVAYIIAKCRIKPVDRVGIIRLFSDDQCEAIKQALFNIRIKRDMTQCATV
jgi:hypothetical protein